MAFQRGAGKSHQTHTGTRIVDARTPEKRLSDLEYSIQQTQQMLDNLQQGEMPYYRQILENNLAGDEHKRAELLAQLSTNRA